MVYINLYTISYKLKRTYILNWGDQLFFTYLEDFITELYKKLNILEPHQLDMFTIAKKLNINIVYRKSVFESEMTLYLSNLQNQKNGKILAMN